MTQYNKPQWVILDSGRAFLASSYESHRELDPDSIAVGPARLLHKSHERTTYKFEVEDQLSIHYIIGWSKRGEENITRVLLEHRFKQSPNAKRGPMSGSVLTCEVREDVRYHPALDVCGEYDPVRVEFLRTTGINEREFEQHLEFGTVEFVRTLAGPLYNWRDGLTKAEAQAALRTASRLATKQKPDENLLTASNDELDLLARPFAGLTRWPGESDHAFRLRLAKAHGGGQ